MTGFVFIAADDKEKYRISNAGNVGNVILLSEFDAQKIIQTGKYVRFSNNTIFLLARIAIEHIEELEGKLKIAHVASVNSAMKVKPFLEKNKNDKSRS